MFSLYLTFGNIYRFISVYLGILIWWGVIHKSVCEAIFLISAGNFMLCTMADVPPIPLTPDYGGPVVSYADGILDVRFISVREGKQSRISLSS